ncbi:sensor histidine kinase [Paenibacillus lemnae]|uniref:histidine kinase n=1 Tax=Paenibacillus lemnae TaxID=1330551 RepID=A0A848M5T4_PAELE|nr:sensor histidine kinase [Paenibacillus lemnae]NMO94964.1 sensor histidine kinase [Paenibacillus lemnae]
MNLKNRWKNMRIRWKFVWLCSLVLLVQFIVSNMYLYTHSADLVRKQGAELVGKYVSQSSGSVQNELANVVSSANTLVFNETFQQYLRKYAVGYFEHENANIDFQFDCVQIFRSLLSQTGNIEQVHVYLEKNIFTVSPETYFNQPKVDLETFNRITASPRANYGWHMEQQDNGSGNIFYRIPLSVSGKTSGLRGWLDVVIRPEAVFRSVQDMASEQVELFVVNEQGGAIYSNREMAEKSVISSGILHTLPEPDVAEIQKVQGEPLMVKMNWIPNAPWLVLASIPKENFQLDFGGYIRTSLFILFIPLIVLAAVILFMTDYILRPLKQLVAVMSSVNQSNVTPQIVTDSQDEFGLLANRFNKMMGRIDDQIEIIKETEQDKREAEMGAFQSQMRQHFLYNTLALISWTARREKARDTERISGLFARYYRLALGKGETYIALERELELLRHYLEIQRCRFVDQLDYEIVVDAETDGYQIIRNLLQPLVENAVEHGVLSNERGKVKVTVREDPDYLIIRIADDGMGADPETVRRINEGQAFDGEDGFSLRSIKKTLHSYYGLDADFDFFSETGAGTMVTVKFLKSRISRSVG